MSLDDEGESVRVETLLTGRERTLCGRLWCNEHAVTSEVVIVVHGLGDHSGRYDSFARQMVNANRAVFAFDLPGHGRSPGRRGHFDNYADVLSDIEAARETVMEQLPGVKQFLLGHSMGGNLAINYVLRYAGQRSSAGPLSGLVLAAPMLLPPNPPPRPQIFAAWLTGHLVPWVKIRRKLEKSTSLQDAKQLAAMRNDPLMHSEITIYLATQLLAQGRWALDHARNIDLPTLVIDCEGDTMIDRGASQNVAIRIGENATHNVLAGGGHDLLQDESDTRAIENILDWIGKIGI